jgi:hypothetical protein
MLAFSMRSTAAPAGIGLTSFVLERQRFALPPPGK